MSNLYITAGFIPGIGSSVSSSGMSRSKGTKKAAKPAPARAAAGGAKKRASSSSAGSSKPAKQKEAKEPKAPKAPKASPTSPAPKGKDGGGAASKGGSPRFFLMKSEPGGGSGVPSAAGARHHGTFSIQQLAALPNQTSCWEGVRNYQVSPVRGVGLVCVVARLPWLSVRAAPDSFQARSLTGPPFPTNDKPRRATSCETRCAWATRPSSITAPARCGSEPCVIRVPIVPSQAGPASRGSHNSHNQSCAYTSRTPIGAGHRGPHRDCEGGLPRPLPVCTSFGGGYGCIIPQATTAGATLRADTPLCIHIRAHHRTRRLSTSTRGAARRARGGSWWTCSSRRRSRTWCVGLMLWEGCGDSDSAIFTNVPPFARSLAAL